MPPKNTPGIKQQPGFPRHESFLRIRHQRQHAGGRYQRHQRGPLRAMLAEGKQQPQERDQKDRHRQSPNIPGGDSARRLRSRRMPALGQTPSATGNLFHLASATALKLRLSPEQKSRQHKEATEQSFQVLGWHGECDQTPPISAEEHSQRGTESCIQVHLALFSNTRARLRVPIGRQHDEKEKCLAPSAGSMWSR